VIYLLGSHETEVEIDALKDSEIASVVTEISSHVPEVDAIYIYGSMSKGEGRSDSDVDIAILTDKPLRVQDVILIKAKLERMLKRDVDLLDLRRASTEMAYQVTTDGICILGEESEKTGLFDVAISSMYFDLELSRRDIVKDVLKRGSVYGR
jgi:predicted nucleotidyltransferase